MKIRTDFVTNSSSSGFVVVTLGFMDGSIIRAENDYNDGSGGYFWNHASEDRLEDAITNACNGKDIYIALSKNIESFSDFIVRFGTGGQMLSATLKRLLTLNDLWFITIEEETHADAIEQGAIYHHVFHPNNATRFHGHGIFNFYPEDWEEYYACKKNTDASTTCCVTIDIKEFTKHIVSHNAQYGVYFLLWYAIDHRSELALSDYDCERIISHIHSAELAALLRIDIGYLSFLNEDDRKRTIFQRSCLNMFAGERKPYKGRDYVKYAIEYYPEDREILINAYNMLLNAQKSGLPLLNDREVNSFVVNYSITPNETMLNKEGFSTWTTQKKKPYKVTSEATYDDGFDDERYELMSQKEREKYWLKFYGSYLDPVPKKGLRNKTFVLSGIYDADLNQTSAYISKLGGVIRSTVSGKTDYLVVKLGKCGYGKVRKAIEQQKKGKTIQIMLLKDFLEASKKETV